jgi:hypothetical protein
MFRLFQRSRHQALQRIRKTKLFVQPENGYVEAAETCSCDVQNICCVLERLERMRGTILALPPRLPRHVLN